MTFSSESISNLSILKIITPFLKSLGHHVSNLQEADLIYEPLKGGGSAASLYRFTVHQRPYVLRLLPPHADPCIRQHQTLLAIQAGQMGFGPKVIFVDDQMQGMIMDYIQGRTAQPSDFEDPSCLRDFAIFLQKLHHSKSNFPQARSPFNRFHDFCLKMNQKNGAPPPRFNEIKALMVELEAIFQLHPIDEVPSHLDLHPLNIMISDHRFFLVDWVNGGLSDPYFDLSTFCVFLSLNQPQALAFLTHYFGREPTHFEWNRFLAARPIRLFVIAAALLSSTAVPSLSYEKMWKETDLPTLKDFAEKGNVWPPLHLALSMLQEGLAIIDQKEFQNSLKALKK